MLTMSLKYWRDSLLSFINQNRLEPWHKDVLDVVRIIKQWLKIFSTSESEKGSTVYIVKGRFIQNVKCTFEYTKISKNWKEEKEKRRDDILYHPYLSLPSFV